MNKKSISLVHPTCSPFARNAALAFSDIGILREVITTVGYTSDNSLLDNLPDFITSKIARLLSSRLWQLKDRSKLKIHPGKELIRYLLQKSGINSLIDLNDSEMVDWVYRSLDIHTRDNHLIDLDAVYAYEDGAAFTFEKAKQKGIKCFYDLPIVFHETARDILNEEAECFPDMRTSLQSLNEPQSKIERKYKELKLADHIFVASSFTKNSLSCQGVKETDIDIIPYGSPVDYFNPRRIKIDKKFRVLFVGRVGARKGVHYLLKAWKDLNLPNSELILIGINDFPSGWLEKYSDSITYIPGVPHNDLEYYYNVADVFVFPSLVEGFGLVILEAMACGLPVIATYNTAAPDIISNGLDGFIIPIRDINSLKEKIEWCYENPTDLSEISINSRKKAEFYNWAKYRKDLSAQVSSLI